MKVEQVVVVDVVEVVVNVVVSKLTFLSIAQTLKRRMSCSKCRGNRQSVKHIDTQHNTANTRGRQEHDYLKRGGENIQTWLFTHLLYRQAKFRSSTYTYTHHEHGKNLDGVMVRE